MEPRGRQADGAALAEAAVAEGTWFVRPLRRARSGGRREILQARIITGRSERRQALSRTDATCASH